MVKLSKDDLILNKLSLINNSLLIIEDEKLSIQKRIEEIKEIIANNE